MLTCRSGQNSTEYKFHERILLTSIILIAFSTAGPLERKGGKKERTEGGMEGRKEIGGKERRQCINYGLVPYLKFQMLLLLNEWQNKCFICNFKIEFIPF